MNEVDRVEVEEVRQHRVGTGRAVVETTDPVAATRVAPTTMVTNHPAATVEQVSSRRISSYPVGYRAIQAVWLVVGIIDTVLAFDFLFRALNARDTGFADVIYSVGGALAAPFDGIFAVTVTNATTGIARWADILAIVIYTLVAVAAVKIARISMAPSDVETV